MKAQAEQAPAPVAYNGQRYSYIPPMEAPLLDVEPMPAPVAPQHVPQPAPGAQPEQQTMYTLDQVRALLAMERAKYV